MNDKEATMMEVVPAKDWITQRAIAEILGVSQRTASVWASNGRFRHYEHGCENCGRRKYSRLLIDRHVLGYAHGNGERVTADGEWQL